MRRLTGIYCGDGASFSAARPGACSCFLFFCVALAAPLTGCHVLFDYEPVSAVEPREASLALFGQTIAAGGQCSSAYAITREIPGGEVPASSADTIVLLSGSGRGQFYADPACTIVSERVQIPAGASSGAFHFRAPLAEQLTFTAVDEAGRFAAASFVVTVAATLLQVEPVYPTNGAAWNSYLKDNGLGPLSALDEPCGGPTEGGCLHGGELRRAGLAGFTDCQALELGDALGVFDWICRPTDDGTGLALYSSGLRADKGLADLVSEEAWLLNRLEIRLGGELVAASEQATWWDNPVVALPDNRAGARIVLDDVDDDGDGPDQSFAPGTIFTVATDRQTNGYNIKLEGAALVTLSSATLSYANSPSANCHEIDATARVSDSVICLLAAGSQRFLWIEGSFDGGGLAGTGLPSYLFNLYRVTFSTLRNLRGQRSAHIGLVLREAARNRLTNVTIANVTDRGVTLNEASDNVIDGLASLNAGEMGMSVSGDVGSGSHRNVLRNVLLDGAVDWSLYFDRGSGNLFHGLRSVGRDRSTKTLIISADDNRFVDLASHRSPEHGLRLAGDRNVFVNVSVTNNALNGLVLDGAVDNTFVGVVAANNGVNGISLSDTSRNVLSHVTAINNMSNGISINGASWNLLHQLVTANNGAAGLTISYNSPVENTIYDLASAHNGSANVRLINASSSHFRGQLIVGSAPANCFVSGGINPGLIHGSCTLSGTTGSNDYGDQVSDATLEIDADLAGALLGQVFSDDPVNTSDADGQRSFPDIVDWSSFASPYRFWGPDGQDLLSSDNRGPCRFGSCRISDVRLSGNQESPLLSRHGTFVSGGVCPPAASGDVFVRDGQSVPSIYLAHAVEILFDGIGDDDGLCESQEACVFSPHLGAFQGDGDLTESCTFSDGQIVGVELRGFSSPAH